VELAKSIVKIFVLSYAAYLSVRGLVPELTGLVQSDAATVAFFFLRVTLRILGACSLVLIVLAALDYAYQRFDYEKNLRMTKQEVKDEHRQQEGDPLIRSRIRSLQMQAARRRMMSQVPRPTSSSPTRHFAVLLNTRRERCAPTVVAKGRGYRGADARAVRRRRAGRGTALARTLHAVEIGQEIPAACQTVAGLAYVSSRQKENGLGIRGRGREGRD
jgi:flagellar biosynthetic protein FlhB